MRAFAAPIVLLALCAAAPELAAQTSRTSLTSLTSLTVEIVAHPETDVDSISKTELSRIFQKKLRTWASGEPAKPVDQPADSVAREAFSRLVHDRSVVFIEVYWKRMIFSGRSLPPRIVANDDEVLEYVRATPGAVGYVGTDADTRGVKKLALVE